MSEQVEAPEGAPKPKKKRAAWMTIYNRSQHGQKITIHNGGKLPPGQTAKVPHDLGERLVDTIWYCVRAERGDPMV